MAAAAISLNRTISSRSGNGPWLIRAQPAAAYSALGGAPGKAIRLSGKGTSRTTRSTTARSHSVPPAVRVSATWSSNRSWGSSTLAIPPCA